MWQNMNRSFRNISDVFIEKLRMLRRLWETGFITGIVLWNNIIRVLHIFMFESGEGSCVPASLVDGEKNNYKGEL